VLAIVGVFPFGETALATFLSFERSSLVIVVAFLFPYSKSSIFFLFCLPFREYFFLLRKGVAAFDLRNSSSFLNSSGLFLAIIN
jgi:hypothetical protein